MSERTAIKKSGQTAYQDFCRIHAEEGITLPAWSTLPHVKRRAFEAVAFHLQRNSVPESKAYAQQSEKLISKATVAVN